MLKSLNIFSRIVFTLFIILTVAAVGLFVFHDVVKRKYPGIAFIYSSEDLLTSNYRFTNGSVGPFKVGFDLRKNLIALNESRVDCDTNGVDLGNPDTMDTRSIRDINGEFIFRCRSLFLPVIYILEIENGVLKGIRYSSSVFS